MKRKLCMWKENLVYEQKTLYMKRKLCMWKENSVNEKKLCMWKENSVYEKKTPCMTRKLYHLLPVFTRFKIFQSSLSPNFQHVATVLLMPVIRAMFQRPFLTSFQKILPSPLTHVFETCCFGKSTGPIRRK